MIDMGFTRWGTAQAIRRWNTGKTAWWHNLDPNPWRRRTGHKHQGMPKWARRYGMVR